MGLASCLCCPEWVESRQRAALRSFIGGTLERRLSASILLPVWLQRRRNATAVSRRRLELVPHPNAGCGSGGSEGSLLPRELDHLVTNMVEALPGRRGEKGLEPEPGANRVLETSGPSGCSRPPLIESACKREFSPCQEDGKKPKTERDGRYGDAAGRK